MGFAIVLLFALGLAVYGIISMNTIADNYQRILDNPNARFILVEEIDMVVTNTRHYAALVSLHTGDIESISRFEGYINEYRELLTVLANEFRENLNNDPVMLLSAKNERNDELNHLVNMIYGYMNNQVNPIIAAARANDMDLAVELIYASLIVNDEVNAVFYDLFNNISTYLELARENNTISRQNTMRNMILVSVITLIVGIVIAVVITKIITKPITTIVGVVKDVSRGNLNVNMDKKNLTNDEIGLLTQDVYGLIDVVKDVVDDVNEMYNQYIVVGNISFKMEEAKYQYAFKEMIESVNKMMGNMTTDIISMAETVDSIVGGDFDETIDPTVWVGEWVFVPQSFNRLLESLRGISVEVNTMIESFAVKGDLSIRIDADKYKGDWRKIMVGLNDITQAVDKPLSIIDVAMNEMRAGNFDVSTLAAKLIEKSLDPDTANYKGVFNQILTNVEVTLMEISSCIETISDKLASISNGDLTQKITTDFVGSFTAIKDSFNSISATLHKTVSEINAASENVLSGAKQISMSATDLANGAQEQASSIEELNASIDMINQQTSQNAENASEANELSNKSTSNAKEGNEAMKQMLVAMEQINESSNNISKIIKTIQDIAFQTNLLSLNAAVEAARAGEHGKGFSVVAEEVRNLASRSQQAAVETTGLIEDSITRVESGSSIAGSTSESLDIIVKNASEVLDIINNISTSSTEQAEAISQASIGLSQISQVVQSNSAVSEEAAAASEELNSQAELLRELVSFFKL